MTSAVSGLFNFNSSSDMHHFEPSPPGATALFLGDQTGGSGWEVKASDGSIERYYVDLPKCLADTKVFFLGAPEVCAGRESGELIEEYLDRLSALIDEADHKFG